MALRDYGYEIDYRRSIDESGGNAMGIDYRAPVSETRGQTGTHYAVKPIGSYWNGTSYITGNAGTTPTGGSATTGWGTYVNPTGKTTASAGGANKWDQGGSMNPYTRISNVKNQTVQSKLDSLIEDWDAFKGKNKTIADNVTKDTQTARDSMAGYNSQEANSIGQLYNGETQQQLDSIIAQKQAALDAIAGRYSMETQGQINQRMAAGGGRGSGYLDRIKANALTKMYQDEAAQMAEARLANLKWLTGQKAAASGLRQNNESNWAKLGVLPLTTNITAMQAAGDALNGISAIDARNNDYGVVREFNGNFVPEQYGGGNRNTGSGNNQIDYERLARMLGGGSGGIGGGGSGVNGGGGKSGGNGGNAGRGNTSGGRYVTLDPTPEVPFELPFYDVPASDPYPSYGGPSQTPALSIAPAPQQQYPDYSGNDTGYRPYFEPWPQAPIVPYYPDYRTGNSGGYTNYFDDKGNVY